MDIFNKVEMRDLKIASQMNSVKEDPICWYSQTLFFISVFCLRKFQIFGEILVHAS
jgi:hypothetical protein